MTDGIAIWGCSKQVEYIFIFLKKAIRIIEKLPQRTPCKDIFKKTTFQPSLATIFWNWHVWSNKIPSCWWRDSPHTAIMPDIKTSYIWNNLKSLFNIFMGWKNYNHIPDHQNLFPEFQADCGIYIFQESLVFVRF